MFFWSFLTIGRGSESRGVRGRSVDWEGGMRRGEDELDASFLFQTCRGSRQTEYDKRSAHVHCHDLSCDHPHASESLLCLDRPDGLVVERDGRVHPERGRRRLTRQEQVA